MAGMLEKTYAVGLGEAYLDAAALQFCDHVGVRSRIGDQHVQLLDARDERDVSALQFG